MSSRRSIRTGRTCQKIGHRFANNYLVCTRCHRSRPAIERGYSKVFRIVRPKRGPWSIRLFLKRLIPRSSSQKSMCHDCAFRAGSPERRDAYGTWSNVLRGVAEHRPFYCHQGMPTDARGAYCPAMDVHGHPIGAALCAGWIIDHKHYHRPGHGLHSQLARLTDAEINDDRPAHAR